MDFFYARLVINLPTLHHLFDYSIPPDLAHRVHVGSLVEVVFNRRHVQGIIIRLLEEPETIETKPILDVLDEEPVVTTYQIALAQWISERSFTPLADCLTMMLPPGLAQQTDTLYRINDGMPVPAVDLTDAQNRLLTVLQERGALRGRQIERALAHRNWKDSARALIRRNILISEPILLSPQVHAKTQHAVTLLLPLDQANAYIEQTPRTAPAIKQRRLRLIEELLGRGEPVSTASLIESGIATSADLRTLELQGILRTLEKEIWRDPLKALRVDASQPLSLTLDQETALAAIIQGLQRSVQGEETAPYLLFGVTGSGKTEIYLQAAAQAESNGRQTIILTPEISLTPQTVRRFMERFPGRVGLIHSHLSPGERYDTWRKARSGAYSIIVGARSALFTPLANPGLIILDECHDPSYNQGDIPPYYQTAQVARHYAQLTHGVLVFGSATPSVEMLYQSQRQGWNRLNLPQRIMAHRQEIEKHLAKNGLTQCNPPADEDRATQALPPIHIVDMRQELQAGNRSVLSLLLKEEIERTLHAQQQAILFLNRRGNATYIFCRECGETINCPQCNFPLTSHLIFEDGIQQDRLICHLCNYQRQLPQQCPQCHSKQIRQYGLGIERLERIVQEMYPKARLLRWDADSTRQKQSHEQILEKFRSRQADILIGTQMLAKGLDMPFVTTVGIILAEVGLNLPDFRAAERTYQLLTQVAGRAGRSALGGRVIMQTYQPQHYAIQAAACYDFEGFYQKELEYRRRLGYPPFSRLLRIEIRNLDAISAQTQALACAELLRFWIKEGHFHTTDLIGPAPCFFSRLQGYYRWQILLRGQNPRQVIQGHDLKDCKVEVDPVDIM